MCIKWVEHKGKNKRGGGGSENSYFYSAKYQNNNKDMDEPLIGNRYSENPLATNITVEAILEIFIQVKIYK